MFKVESVDVRLSRRRDVSKDRREEKGCCARKGESCGGVYNSEGELARMWCRKGCSQLLLRTES